MEIPKINCGDCSALRNNGERDIDHCEVCPAACELIDGIDNECHDTGSFSDMLADAVIRNEAEAEPMLPNGMLRWQVHPEGYSDVNYNGVG